MSDAPWKKAIERLEFVWGKDAEGAARGFSWCCLCGSHCEEGVVVISVPREPRGSAFFCASCVEKMANAASRSTS